MNIDFYYVEEHLGKNYSIKWDLVKGNVGNPFWEKWAKKHPERSRMLNQAVKILTAMVEGTVDWEQENQDRVWQEIQNRMDQRNLSDTQTQRVV